MDIGPTPPLVSKTLDTPTPSAWLTRTSSGHLGVSTMSNSEERRRAYGYNAYEEELFSFDDLNGFARSAVQAEQDLIQSLIEKLANVVTPHCKVEDACGKLANETLIELAELRRLVTRGRGSEIHGGEKEPSWWWSENDTEKWKFAKEISRRMRETRKP
jgi:hypothetical protein